MTHVVLDPVPLSLFQIFTLDDTIDCGFNPKSGFTGFFFALRLPSPVLERIQLFRRKP